MTRPKLEILCLILTGVIHVGLKLLILSANSQTELFGIHFIGNIVFVLGWSEYVLYRVLRNKGILHDWGFRLDNFKQAAVRCLWFAIISVPVLFCYGYFLKGIRPSLLSFCIILLIYPIWGLLQQFALQVFANRNLRELGLSLAFRLPIVALMFGLSHFPNYALVLLVFILGFVTTWIYEKYPNFWALALLHGVLGTFAYFMVLGLDPAAEILKKL